MQKNKKGFTLVEIIVVLLILSILAAVAVPSVYSYVEEAKETRELAKLRESLIAAQVVFTKSAMLGEKSDKYFDKDYFLTKSQTDDFEKYLAGKPYTLLFGVGDVSVYGENSIEASHIYSIIYQKDENSKPWYYDGMKWSHKYLWSKNGASPGETAGRAMFVKNNKNIMKDVKDSKGNQAVVTMYYTYARGKRCTSNTNMAFLWNDLKKNSE